MGHNRKAKAPACHGLNQTMKKAFTLIELLVVIAIIAILAAILFPVFAQAKNAAKKTAGLSQAKQIGLALNMYANDSEDCLPPYRFAGPTGAVINPTYLDLQAKGDPRAATMQANGAQTLRTVFFSEMINPYTKSKDLWKSPGNPEAWSGFQDKGNYDPGFHSYGGQNSYGSNNWVLKPHGTTIPDNSPTVLSSLAEVSNTMVLVDATYYNAFPYMGNTYCKLNGVDFAPSSRAGYTFYWKHLGNNKHNFNSPGSNDPANASNATVIKNIEARFAGQLNMVMADSSAKARPAKEAVNNFMNKPLESYWNPTKGACEPQN